MIVFETTGNIDNDHKFIIEWFDNLSKTVNGRLTTNSQIGALIIEMAEELNFSTPSVLLSVEPEKVDYCIAENDRFSIWIDRNLSFFHNFIYYEGNKILEIKTNGKLLI